MTTYCIVPVMFEDKIACLACDIAQRGVLLTLISSQVLLSSSKRRSLALRTTRLLSSESESLSAKRNLHTSAPVTGCVQSSLFVSK